MQSSRKSPHFFHGAEVLNYGLSEGEEVRKWPDCNERLLAAPNERSRLCGAKGDYPSSPCLIPGSEPLNHRRRVRRVSYSGRAVEYASSAVR